MKHTNYNINEKRTEAAFSKQAAIFDDLYSSDTIIKYKRNRVRDHVKQLIKPHSTILELNAGTGEDAVYFAQQGHHVHATDISAGMQQVLIKKIKFFELQDKVTSELCSFTDLNKLRNKGPYDLIFSNFAGLNCTAELYKALNSFHNLLNPGGIVTLVILPRFCLWETLLLFKGKFKTALRRFFSSNGRRAHLQGQYFKCWYYNPSYITNHLKTTFDLLNLEGLCTVMPPSYLQHFAEKRPKLYKFLEMKETAWKSKWPWKYIGDYYIISLKRKDQIPPPVHLT